VSFGRAAVVARVGALADTAYLSIVPQGTFAAAYGRALVLSDFDGTNRRDILEAYVSSISWSPTGTSLVYQSSTPEHIYLTDLAGRARTLVSDTAPHLELTPRFSPDGAWIYFSGVTGFAGFEIRRMRPDGTGTTRIGPAHRELLVGDVDPSLSPDGSRIVYNSPNFEFSILDLATGAITKLPSRGIHPRWSPKGDQILFVGENGYLWTVHPDGSGLHLLAETNYDRGASWSPDGKYVVASNFVWRRLDVIEVGTGATLPLPYSGGMEAAEWMP
jgi:Tol biopolymer transport system component